MVTMWAARLGVDDVDEGGEGGALAAPGGSGDQHQALAPFGEFGQVERQVQGFERGDARGQQANAGGERAALMVDVDAEASDGRRGEAEVDGFAFLEFVELPGFEQGEHEAAHIVGIERGAAAGSQSAVDAQHGGGAGDEEHIGGAARVGESAEVDRARRGLRQPRGAGILLAGRGAVQFGYNFRKFVIVFAHVRSVHATIMT